jgi:radical SAM superfamily enzyme YgiQ (UPF0313 family)
VSPDNALPDLAFLFVHVPKSLEIHPPFGAISTVNYISSGLFSMADILDRAGIPTRILHLGIERCIDPGFDLAAFVSRHRIPAVGFSLQWHHSIADVLEEARKVKDRCPDTRVILGGLTATHFHREIRAACPYIDHIALGEGERQIVSLARNDHAVASSASPRLPHDRLAKADTPQSPAPAPGSLSPRLPHDRLAKADTPHSPAPAPRALSSRAYSALNFERFDLLLHHEWLPGQHYILYPRRPRLNRALVRLALRNTYFVPLGRGCSMECAFCGGSRSAQKALMNRTAPAFRSPESVEQGLRLAVEQGGFKTVSSSFDPTPWARGPLLAVLEHLVRAGPRLSWSFDVFRPPDRDLLKALAAASLPGSRVVLSVNSLNEEVRSRIMDFPYSDSDLLRSLDLALAEGVRVFLSVPRNVPLDPVPATRAEREMERRLARHPAVTFMLRHPLELDPASALERQPERYGSVVTRRTFDQYLAYHASRTYDHGFHPAGHTPASWQETLCRTRCSLGFPGGRLLCKAMMRDLRS